MGLLAQSDGSAAGGVLGGFLYFAVILMWVIGMWKMFEKAGQPGWFALVPIFNAYVLVRISGKEWWWFLLLLVPCVNIVAYVLVTLGIAERFGKSPAYALGLIVFPFIFYLLLGYGTSEYRGPIQDAWG